MSPRAVIRASASAKTGAGHVIRMGALARALMDQGWHVAFVSAPSTPAVIGGAFVADGMSLVAETDAGPAEAAAVGRAAGKVDLCVVDDYRLGADFERACRDWAKHVLSVSDLPDRPRGGDFLLDPSGGRDAGAYAGLIAPDCKVFAGPAYALLRPAFAVGAAQASGPAIDAVFVSMGATDPDNLTGEVVLALRETLPDAEVHVVLSGAAPHVAEIQRLADRDGKVVLHIDANDVAGIMAGTQFAVGTGGIGLWERCALGLPSITVVVADNQRANALYAEQAGATIRLDAGAGLGEAIGREVLALAGDPDRRTAMAAAGRGVCDGRGADRLAGELDALVRAR